MEIQVRTKDAYRLMHEGILALAEIERNGIRIDEKYGEGKAEKLEKEIEQIEIELENSPEGKEWRTCYGRKTNFDSGPQLGDMLFNKWGIKSERKTDTGRNAVDQEVLESIDFPFVKKLLRIRKLRKVKSTYLRGILREAVNGHIHPSFNLHTVRTFRSSSDSPNFQNIPIRDLEVRNIIRRMFIPRPGHRFGGIDYSGIEIKIGAAYHQDPRMIEYLTNPANDLHRDMAMECYLLKKDEVTKDTRFYAKNGFVFPQFYGDYYANNAKSLWGAIDEVGLIKKDGTPLKEHLRDQGIKSYGQFEGHIQNVEYRFWNEMFSVYKKWKEDWVRIYADKGYFDMYTGFRCKGVLGKNDIINYPVQGTAFHCLLWSLIRIQEWMVENNLISRIVGQIHDEIVMDAYPEELNNILIKCNQTMCYDIREMWKWLIVPMEIEAEFGEVDESWVEGKIISIPGGDVNVITS